MKEAAAPAEIKSMACYVAENVACSEIKGCAVRHDSRKDWPMCLFELYAHHRYASVGTVANPIWAIHARSRWEFWGRVQQVEASGRAKPQDSLGMGTPSPLRGVTPRKLIVPHDIAHLLLRQVTAVVALSLDCVDSCNWFFVRGWC